MKRRAALVAAVAGGTAAAIPAPRRAGAAGPVRIMPVGDSLTFGAGATAGGYRSRLAARLADLGHTPTMLNASANGMTLDRIRPLIDAALVGGPPDITIWALGTNDAFGPLGGWPERYRAEITRVLEVLPGSHAVVCTLPLQPRNPQLFRNVNVWLCNIVAAPLGDRVAVCEWESLPAAMLTDGGVHPGDAGHTLIAEMLRDT